MSYGELTVSLKAVGSWVRGGSIVLDVGQL
jgi:hypothetical protein